MKHVPLSFFPKQLGFVLALSLAAFSPMPGKAQTIPAAALAAVPKERLALLAKGINLNSTFTGWTATGQESVFTKTEADFLHAAGFTFVRLPLKPQFLLDFDNPASPKDNLPAVDHVVKLLLDSGIAVVFDPLHGSSDTAELESRLYHDTAFREAVGRWWENLARHYAAISKDRIFFEIMNEPHLTSKEKITSAWWPAVQSSLAKAIRAGAPESTIIATGERWGGIDGLLELQPLDDPDIVYSFHDYDPMTFTHQGANWAGPVLEKVQGMPYPSSPEALSQPAAALSDSEAKKYALGYGRDHWNAQRVLAGLKRVSDWSAAHKVPVFCGEFGVYRKVAGAEDRLRWISDMRTSLESLGMGWSMWDYETDFGLVSFSEPHWRRGPIVESGCLEALGLDKSQGLAADSLGPTLADFSAGNSTSLDIPPASWNMLWTRDAKAGTESLQHGDDGQISGLKVDHHGANDWSLGSGMVVPVHEGEKYSLESFASFSGSGSLSLELVARDASGKVTAWDYASVKITESAGKAYSTSFTVKPGIVSLEPRWSGRGPGSSVVESLVLTRGEGSNP